MQGDPKNTKKDLMLKNQFYTQIYLANCGDYGLVLVICQNPKSPIGPDIMILWGKWGL